MKKGSQPSIEYEMDYWKQGKLVAGVDEAGRGPLAGPVFAAAVILPDNIEIINDLLKSGLNDSKQVIVENRNILYEKILNNALSVSFASVDNFKIDKINILNATFEAMNSAISNLTVKPDFLFIDGNRFKNFTKIPYNTIVKGDAKSVSIAAASIIAKVTRDKYMINIDTEYPQYYFSKNKGYGTKQHIEAIEIYGACHYHRKSFLKKISKEDIYLF
jgi:ribonuclease HII